MFKTNKKLKIGLYIISLCLCFSVGAKIWKVYRSSGLYYHKTTESISGKSKILAYVGGSEITRDELEAYYYLQTKDVSSLIKEDNFMDDKEAQEDLKEEKKEKKGFLFHKEEEDSETKEALEKSGYSIKEAILTRLIERELLFKMMLKDSSFDETKLEKDCQEEWDKYKDIYSSDNRIGRRTLSLLRDGICKDMMVSKYLEEMHYSKITLTEEELHKYYEDHISHYDLPSRVLVRQIVLPTEAEAIQVQNGLTRANFKQRVEQYSISLDKEQGGLVGPFSKGQMPHFFDVAFLMKKGQIQGVVKSDYGFHLFLLEEKYPSKKLTFNEAKKDVQKHMTELKREEVYAKLMDLALSTFKVETMRVSL